MILSICGVENITIIQKLEEIATKENLQRKSIDNLLAGVGSGNGNETNISIGWPAIDILRVDEPQQRIETRGVAGCYAIFGINSSGDVILGHYTQNLPREIALQLARYLIEQQNLQHQRKLDFDTFRFGFIPGPKNPDNPKKNHRKRYSHYNVYYDRNEGLHIVTYEDLQLGKNPIIEPLIHSRKPFDKPTVDISYLNKGYLKVIA